MKRIIITAVALLAICATPLAAHFYAIGDLEITHPHAPTTPTRAKTGVGYMAITNNSETPDTLIAVKAEFANPMLHRTEMKANDVMTMPHQKDGIVIAPGDTVLLESGGYHIMFMGLSAPFVDGDLLKATLVFEHAGELDIEFKVLDHGAETKMEEMDHSKHDK